MTAFSAVGQRWSLTNQLARFCVVVNCRLLLQIIQTINILDGGRARVLMGKENGDVPADAAFLTGYDYVEQSFPGSMKMSSAGKSSVTLTSTSTSTTFRL